MFRRRVCFPAPLKRSFCEIVFRPMVNKGMARGVSAILQRAPGLKDF